MSAVQEVVTEAPAIEAVPKRAMTLGYGTSLIILGLLILAPMFVKHFITFQLTMLLIYGLAVLALNILTGGSGQFSLGQSAFYAVGAYTSAILMEHAGMNYALTLPISGIICFGFGFLFGGFFNFPDKWRLAFYISAVPGLILAALMFGLRRRDKSEDDPETTESARTMSIFATIKRCWTIPTFRVILFQHAFGFFPLTAIGTFLVLYLSHEYGADSSFGAAGLGATIGSILPGGLLVVGGIIGGIYGGAWANRLRRKYIGARVRVGGLGFLLAAPFVIITLGAPYLLRALPAYTALSASTQVMIGVVIFALGGLFAAFFINVYNGPTSAALQDVLPPSLRAAGGGLELMLAHLLGDVWAAAAVGAIADAFASQLGGEQIGLALLVTCPIALILAGVIGIWGSRFYKQDVEALGASAEAMVGA